jgi:hypothetical protein
MSIITPNELSDPRCKRLKIGLGQLNMTQMLRVLEWDRPLLLDGGNYCEKTGRY